MNSDPRRVYLVRASFLAPNFVGSILYGVADLADVVRRGVHRYLERDVELDVRLSSCVEITDGINLGAIEPEDPADIELALGPNPADLAEALRIVAGHSMMLPEPRHLAALAASAERWRMRFAARLATPEGRAIFDQAVSEVLSAHIPKGDLK